MLREDMNQIINQSKFRNPIIIINKPIPAYDPNKTKIEELKETYLPDETFAEDYVKIN